MNSAFKISVVPDGLIIETGDEVYHILMDSEEMMMLSTQIVLMLTQENRDKSKMNGTGHVAGQETH
jgi:hypothetical protein